MFPYFADDTESFLLKVQFKEFKGMVKGMVIKFKGMVAKIKNNWSWIS